MRVKGDRAGGPIEAAQDRMSCEAGLVKIQLAARAVPDINPGSLVREHRQQLPAGPPSALVVFSQFGEIV
jgi:hypothetical protein